MADVLDELEMAIGSAQMRGAAGTERTCLMAREEIIALRSKLDAAEKERDRAVARAARIAELDPDWERADDDMQGALWEIQDLTVKNINLQNELAAAADVELMRFYTVESVPALVKALSHHVEKLQDKLQRCYGPQERIRTAVREG